MKSRTSEYLCRDDRKKRRLKMAKMIGRGKSYAEVAVFFAVSEITVRKAHLDYLRSR